MLVCDNFWHNFNTGKVTIEAPDYQSKTSLTYINFYHCTYTMLYSVIPSPAVPWYFSGSKGSAAVHSRASNTQCGTSIVTTIPCAILMVHKCFTMMNNKVMAVVLIVAEPIKTKRKHYKVIH